jgi:hypothetical protein
MTEDTVITINIFFLTIIAVFIAILKVSYDDLNQQATV